jgi:hypothetical protein
MTIEFILQEISLYSGCAVPSIVFYLVTKGQTMKSTNAGAPDWLLVFIGLVQVLVPILYNARGTVLDRVFWAVMAIVMTSGMFFYIRDRRQTPEGKQLKPFYDILTRWNESPSASASASATHGKKKEVSLLEIRTDGLRFLLRAVVYALVYIPFFATMDGFVRACKEPPEIFTAIPYLQRLFTASIPVRTTFYHFWVGITLTLHIALVPLVHLLLHAIQLNIAAWIPNVDYKILLKLHHDLVYFVAQPPLFDKPWLTRSVYDLWSRRWHQIFRPGFYQVAYRPVRSFFDKKYKAAGRIAGTIAVFTCSGLMHDYIVLVMLGYSNYKTPGVLGYQTLFFVLQGLATLASWMAPRLPTWLARALTWVWVIYTGPLFVEPYIRVGLHLNAEVPGFPKFMDSRIGPICPYGTR